METSDGEVESVDLDTTDELVEFNFGDAEPEAVEVSAVGPNRYRVASTPLNSKFFNDPDACILRYGDIFEAERIGEGKLKFIRMVDKANVREYSWLIAKEVIETEEFAAYGDAVLQVGGMWERWFGGLLIVHVPVQSTFDPERELERVFEHIKLRNERSP